MNLPNNQQDTLYVDTDAACVQACAQLAEAEYLALDTEFIREKTYFPELCLLQITGPRLTALFDPQALSTLDPIIPLLLNAKITKVFHSGSQDLELLYQTLKVIPQPIYDTQVAASLLGYPLQVSYAALIEKELGIALDKNQTRTLWSRRPLTAAQCEYAADDVRYLYAVYPLQLEALNALGRLAWLTPELEHLTLPEGFQSKPQDLWKKVKGHQTLHGIELALLQAYAQWRDALAQLHNRPRKFVVSDTALLDLVRFRPAQLSDLNRALPPNLGKPEREELIALTQKILQQPASSWPRLADFTRLNPDQEALVSCLGAVLRHYASQANLCPELIAGRKDLEQLVLGATDLAVLSGWRHEQVGQHLQRFLQGGCSVRAHQGKLELSYK